MPTTSTNIGQDTLLAWQPQPEAPVWERAEGEHVHDRDGRTFIDMAMGHGALLWGHGTVYRRILENYDVEELAQGVGSTHTVILRERATHELVEWARAVWGGAPQIQAGILHTGAEAVEAALKTALSATRRPEVVAFRNSYHGSFGVAAAVSDGAAFRSAFEPAVTFNGIRREPYGEVPQLSERTACVIVEPVQGAGGAVIPPHGFLRELRAECDRVGALLILDDVLAGSGRTGTPLEGADCGPDIITLAKAIGGGMVCSAVLMKREVAQRAWGGEDAPSLSTTYYAHPFSCAAILEVLALHRQCDLRELCSKFEPALRAIEQQTSLTVRGKGAFWALVGSRAGAGIALSQRLLDLGVIASPSGPDNEALSLLPHVLMAERSLDEVVEAVVTAARG